MTREEMLKKIREDIKLDHPEASPVFSGSIEHYAMVVWDEAYQTGYDEAISLVDEHND